MSAPGGTQTRWVARNLLRIADDAGMTDADWHRSAALRQARQELGVPEDGRVSHSVLWGRPRVSREIAR